MDLRGFERISIRGRFIYGYLCLLNALERSGTTMPSELNELFHEFVSSNRLDDWQTKVDDILPSFILDVEGANNEYFSVEVVDRVKQYYKTQPSFIVEIIEDLFWVGISNLYVGYNSENSLKYLKLILDRMDEKSVPLPDFEKIKKCSASQRHGWGENDDLKIYTDTKASS